MSIDWNSFAVGCGMTAVAHPFTFTKILVQLGHEPLAPMMRRNMFFRKQLQYPSLFEYMKYIKRRDGYLGLYRGLLPRMCANATATLTYSCVSHAVERRDATSCSATLPEVCDQTSKEMVARCAAAIVSHPFHVIAVRAMAQFIGNETVYNSMRSAVDEIYTEEGFLGFFAGLAPRLVSEIISIWMCNLLAHAVNNYILTEASELKDLRQYSHLVMGYFAQTVTYPLLVTSTIMTVNGARLEAAQPPFVPKYDGWVACLRDLRKNGLTSRGSSMIFRKAVAHVYAAGSVVPAPAPTFS